MCAGLLAGPFWAVGLVGVGYAFMNTAWIVSEARLQERAPSAQRATVASVVAFFANVLSALVFLVVAGLSRGDDPTLGVVVCAAGVLVAAAWIVGYLPAREPGGEAGE